MKRREFMTLLGGAAAWPLAARAQPPVMPVIGFLSSAPVDQLATSGRAFRQGLSEVGFIESQNVVIDLRGVGGQYDRLRALADELTRRPVTMIVAGGVPATLAAKAASTKTPIVFYIGADPIELRLVGSLNRPGGNLTGVTLLNTELGPKRLELLHELVPTATAIAVLVNPSNRNAALSTDMQAAARTLGLQLHILHASTDREIDIAFANLAQLRAGGLMISADGLFVSRSEQLAALAVRHAVPAIFQFREFAAGGGLMSYGGSATEAYRLVGVYAGRVLKGEKPADLPVQQATKIELIINLKSAKALGLTVPLPLIGRADEVIE
jgi:putative tryptophan/tyrosine transport system substrate-binding protein